MTAEECIQKAYQSILHSDFEQAIHWFEQAIACDPNNASYYYRLSITYARSQRLAQAIAQAELAVLLAPEQSSYLHHLNCLQARRKTGEAEQLLTRSFQETHEAIMLLKEAIELDPLSILSYIMIAMAYAHLQDYYQAIQYLREAQKLDPYEAVVESLLTQYTESLAKLLNSK